MPLTTLKVRTAGPGKHIDQRGLILNVLPSGHRHWMLRMGFKGRRQDLNELLNSATPEPT